MLRGRSGLPSVGPGRARFPAEGWGPGGGHGPMVDSRRGALRGVRLHVVAAQGELLSLGI
jgi:hypothetical protein